MINKDTTKIETINLPLLNSMIFLTIHVPNISFLEEFNVFLNLEHRIFVLYREILL